jgi:hypothetical protein
MLQPGSFYGPLDAKAIWYGLHMAMAIHHFVEAEMAIEWAKNRSAGSRD